MPAVMKVNDEWEQQAPKTVNPINTKVTETTVTVRTGMSVRDEDVVLSLLDSRLEELRSIADQPSHLSGTDSLTKLQALHQKTEMFADKASFSEKKRAQMVDWIFGLTAMVPSLPDKTYFSAVYILDCSLMEHAERILKLSDEENQSVWIAAVKLAASAVNAEVLCALRGAIDKLGCRDEDIKHWEDELAVTLIFNSNARTSMQSVHLLQMDYWVQEMMKPDEFQSAWSMIDTLVSVAVSKASLLKRRDALLLPAAIMRITLELFDSRKQLLKPLNSTTIKCLFGEKFEHVAVALELLNWILSDERLCPALTEKMKDAKSEFRKISRQMQIICDVLPHRTDFDQ